MSSPIVPQAAENVPPWQSRAEELMRILRGPDDAVEAAHRMPALTAARAPGPRGAESWCGRAGAPARA